MSVASKRRARVLAECRREIGATLREIAELTEHFGKSVSRSHLSQCERGSVIPSEESFEAWSKAVGAMIKMRQRGVAEAHERFVPVFGFDFVADPGIQVKSRSERASRV